jgi:MoxR-like ATPase
MIAAVTNQTSTARERLFAVKSELEALLVERDQAIAASLGAMLSRNHVLLLGPPGTAKSMLAHQLCQRIGGAAYFQWLLTKFTTPDEVFGAVSLAALERDEYRRVTDLKLPTSHIAFLDEIFKANSAILNAILTVLNERVFHNGRAAEHVPLLTLFGASNELPEEDELSALYDRFLVRLHVGPIEEGRRFIRMLTSPEPPAPRAFLSLADIAELQAAAERIEVPEKALHDIVKIRERLAERGIVASDRRWQKAVGFLRAMALIEGATRVDDSVLAHLVHCLWSDPAEADAVRAALGEVLTGFEEEARRLLYQAREVHAFAERPHDDPQAEARAAIEAHAKLNRLAWQVDRILEQVRDRGAPTGPVQDVKDEIVELARRILGD